jgi:23S rRNA pseudouridine1911/1915/1917 synthase
MSTEGMNEDALWEDEDLQEVRLHLKVDKGQEMTRIDKFLQHLIKGATRNKIQQAIESDFVLVDGKPVKSNYKIKAGQEITVFEYRRQDTTEIIPQKMNLNIVYEDEDLLVVNKPDSMVVHPGCGNYSNTLVNGIAYYLNPDENKERIIELPRVGLVHRIDKDTSGLLVIGKTEAAVQHLSAQFKRHEVHRRYIGLAWGDFESDSGTITGHVGRNLRFRKKMDVFPEGDHGKHAITHYKVLERFHYTTLLEFRLETGRTHQIRVHAKYIGHPLFNDETYGGNVIVKGTVYAKYKQFVENNFKILPRHALHAKELGFIHPTKGVMMRFDSELPKNMQQVIDRWRAYVQQPV